MVAQHTEKCGSTAVTASRYLLISAFGAIFLSFCLLKYYPLRVSMYVSSQYLWPYGDGNFRRGVLPTIAGLFHNFDPERILPVINFFSTVQLVLLSLTAAWAWQRLSRRRTLLVAAILALASGLVPHLLAARGSQDGFVLLLIVLFGILLTRRNLLMAGFVATLAVMVHEAALPYLISVMLLHAVLDKPQRSTATHDRLNAFTWGLILLTPSVLVAVFSTLLTHVDQQTIETVCSRYKAAMEFTPYNDIITNMDKADIKYYNWGANCGLQFRHYQGSISFFLRSCFVGFLFAPVVLFFVATIWKVATLSSTRKTIAVGAVILPALLMLVAYDTSRFWSYMNATALYGVFLSQSSPSVTSAPTQNSNNASDKLGLTSLVFTAVCVLLSITIYLGPTDWERQQAILPSSVAGKFPTLRRIICNVSQSGLCYRPIVDIR